MAPEEMERIYREHIDAENRQDVDGCLATYADDCYHEQAAWGEIVRGKDEVRAYYERVFSFAPGNHVDIEGITTGENVLIAWGRFSMDLSEGHFMGHPIDRPGTYSMHGFTIVPFKDGLMEAERTYPDLIGFARETGLKLDPLLEQFRQAA